MSFRISGAKEVRSLCPYCAVGCALIAYTKQGDDGKTHLLQIEGDQISGIVGFPNPGLFERCGLPSALN